MRSQIQMTLAVTAMLASGLVAASSANYTSSAQHSYQKRELSDSSYNRLAIIHASGTYWLRIIPSNPSQTDGNACDSGKRGDDVDFSPGSARS